jgi:GT2 family glycosyltransferase
MKNASVSYLVITFNRRVGLLDNLRAIYSNDPVADVWVVDNASCDDTALAVRNAFPQARLIRLADNLGMPARNVALRQMTTDFAVLLDDDSHPLNDAVSRSVAHMRAHADVAAVVGRVELPDGSVEAPAMPAVLLGGASCVRLSALREVGYFPDDFFRQAEEYDLSCRLWNAGYRVERFEDVRFRHNKIAAPGRASSVVASLDLKHNLIIAARYLPAAQVRRYSQDFVQRYGAILRDLDHANEIDLAIESAWQTVRDPLALRRQPLNDDAFEAIFDHRRQMGRIGRWARENNVRRVAIADFSKNLLATWQACTHLGLDVAGIVDDRPAFRGEIYRQAPVVPLDAVVETGVDGVVISNTNPAQVPQIARRVTERVDRPVLPLWRGALLNSDLRRVHPIAA